MDGTEIPPAIPPTQVLANAHLLRSQHGWSQSDVDGYVQEQTGLPSMVELARQISAPSPAEGQPGLLPTIATKFGQGASFNFADRLSGAVDALLAGIKQGQIPSDLPTALASIAGHPAEYQAGRDQARQYYAAAQAAHPVASDIANGVGNLASSVIGGAALKAPATILGAAGQGALLGGGSSALATAGNQPDLTDPSALWNSLKSGGIGAGIGAVTGGLGQFALRHLLGNPAQLAAEGVTRGGGADALQQSEAALRASLPEGTPITPADLSPSLQNLAQAAVQKASPGVAEPLVSGLRARAVGQPQRIAASLKDLLGGAELDTPSRVAQLDALVRQIGNDPETGYQALNEAVGPISDPRLTELLGRPAVRDAFNRAIISLRNAGEKVAFEVPGTAAPDMVPGFEPTAAPPPAGAPGIDPNAVQVPNFQVLHATLQTLGDDANALIAKGGKAGFTGHALQQAAQDLRQVIADNVPQFEDLQSRYSAAKDLLDAANDAGDVANKSISDLQDHVSKLTPEQLPEFRRALAAKVYDQLRSAGETKNIAGTLLADPAFKAKMEVAFGDPETFQRFLDSIQGERTLGETASLFPKRGPVGATPEMGQGLPVSVGVSYHGEGGPRPYIFAHGLGRTGASVTANPLAQALLAPQRLDEFLQTVQRLNARGTLPRQILSSLPGGIASVATQP